MSLPLHGDLSSHDVSLLRCSPLLLITKIALTLDPFSKNSPLSHPPFQYISGFYKQGSGHPFCNVCPHACCLRSFNLFQLSQRPRLITEVSYNLPFHKNIFNLLPFSSRCKQKDYTLVYGYGNKLFFILHMCVSGSAHCTIV